MRGRTSSLGDTAEQARPRTPGRRRYRRRDWPDSPRWTPAFRLWVLTAALLFATVVWWGIREFTTIVVVAVLLTYMMNPAIVRVAARFSSPRPAAALGVYAGLAVFLISIPLVLAPGVLAPVMRADIPASVNSAIDEIFAALPTEVTLFGRPFNLMSGYAEVEAELRAATGTLVNAESLRSLAGYATDFAVTLLALLVTYFVSLYLAMDAPRVLEWIRGLVPEPYINVYDAVLEDVEGVWRQFFRGQIILMVIVGALSAIGLIVLGVPYALGLALLAGILEVVPRLGPVLATIPAMTVALVSQSSTFDGLSGIWFAAAVLVLYVLIQQAENNILVPRVLGGSVNLHPAVVLIAALAGAKLAGVVGIILAAPLLGSARVMGSWIYHQLTRTDAHVES